jgi:acyl-CoA synthetase (AMP-forming)/AMP-acid ligase II
MNTSDFLLARAHASSVAIVDGERNYSYGELRAAVVCLARELEATTAVGDRVGIVARNSFFWAAAYLAAMYAGRVAVPLATTTPPDEARSQAAWVGARTFFVERGQMRRFAPVVVDAFTISDAALDGLSDNAPRWAPLDVDSDADAILQLTSGTTSAPKAVRVTHGNIQANTASIVEYLDLQPDDRMLVVLPFSYCFGASLLHTHLRVGGTVVLCHTLTFPESVIDALDQHRCTGFAGVPSTYQLLMRASSLLTRPLPSVRHLQQAGGKLAPALVDELVAAQPGARVFVMYGQTEATARLSYLPPGDLDRHRGSIGRGVPGLRLRVVDEQDRDVAPGDVGEIVASGPSITKGYWNDPEATAMKFRGGLLRTGDLGTVDEDGYVYIVDRVADFIKSWGFRISSQEIEEVALGIPDVLAAAAVGIPDDVAGEVVALFIVPSNGDLVVDDVLAELRGRLAKHMVPEQVTFVPELPLNANGKLVKSRLRELAAAPGVESLQR